MPRKKKVKVAKKQKVANGGVVAPVSGGVYYKNISTIDIPITHAGTEILVKQGAFLLVTDENLSDTIDELVQGLQRVISKKDIQEATTGANEFEVNAGNAKVFASLDKNDEEVQNIHKENERLRAEISIYKESSSSDTSLLGSIAESILGSTPNASTTSESLASSIMQSHHDKVAAAENATSEANQKIELLEDQLNDSSKENKRLEGLIPEDSTEFIDADSNE